MLKKVGNNETNQESFDEVIEGTLWKSNKVLKNGIKKVKTQSCEKAKVLKKIPLQTMTNQNSP